MTSQKHGISVRTAAGVWAWEARRWLGCVCANCGGPWRGPARERLSGSVEAETYLGELEEGRRGRQTESKALIVVAAQEDGKGTGRIRMQHIPDASAHSLISFVQGSVEPGSVVPSGGSLGYEPLQPARQHPSDHVPARTAETPFRAVAMRASRGVAVKAPAAGTHHGAVSIEHLEIVRSARADCPLNRNL